METQVLIVGGGVTGACLARDLSLRGVRCIVVERRDINSGASGANHGLLHSGARYAAVDPVSARECHEESQRLKRLAPHCIEQTGGLFVALPGDDERYIADFSDHCARCGITAVPLSPREAIGQEPGLSEEIIAAFNVDDAAINPFKFSLDNLAQAEALGARLFTHTELVGFERDGKRITRARLRRQGQEQTVDAEQIVNATGVWGMGIAAMAGISLPMVASKGSILITQTRLTDRVINRLHPPADGDIIVPSGTVNLIGTTSVRIDRLDRIHPTFGEIDFLIAEAARMIPEFAQARYIRGFAGARPLLCTDGSLADRSLSRSFSVRDHASEGVANFVSILGGKLTTARLMAEKVADLVCARLGVTTPCRTHELPLPESEVSRWVEPEAERRNWLRQHTPEDTMLCECEMIPMSAVDALTEWLTRHGDPVGLSALSLRSRVGKGSCQGAFCAFRICAHLYDRGLFRNREGLDELQRFLEQRWDGLRTVLWGRQLVQEQLQEAIHCGLFNLELEPTQEPT